MSRIIKRDRATKSRSSLIWKDSSSMTSESGQGRCHEVLKNMVKVVFNKYVAENHQLALESFGKGKPNCTKEVC